MGAKEYTNIPTWAVDAMHKHFGIFMTKFASKCVLIDSPTVRLSVFHPTFKEASMPQTFIQTGLHNVLEHDALFASTGMVVWVLFVFLLAGFVKGVSGMGMPLTALTLLTPWLGLKLAIMLILVPSLVTNVWQAFFGGAWWVLLRRLWSLLIMGCLGIAFASRALLVVDTRWLIMLLGLMVLGYSSLNLRDDNLRFKRDWEWWLNPFFGLFGGVMAGLTGVYGGAVPYLNSLGFGRQMLVQALGIWFLMCAVVLGVALGGHGVLPQAQHWWMLTIGLPPALVGMQYGRMVRQKIPERRFKRLFLYALMVVSIWMIGRFF